MRQDLHRFAWVSLSIGLLACGEDAAVPGATCGAGTRLEGSTCVAAAGGASAGGAAAGGSSGQSGTGGAAGSSGSGGSGGSSAAGGVGGSGATGGASGAAGAGGAAGAAGMAGAAGAGGSGGVEPIGRWLMLTGSRTQVVNTADLGALTAVDLGATGQGALWSPRGDALAMLMNDRVEVVHFDGSVISSPTIALGARQDVAWSREAHSLSALNGTTLEVVGPSGAAPTSASISAQARAHAWSPSSDPKLAFTNGVPDGRGVFFVDVADGLPGAPQQVLDDADGGSYIELLWSPDGAWLAAIASDQVAIIPASATAPGQENAHEDLQWVSDVRWSPDSSRLVYRAVDTAAGTATANHIMSAASGAVDSLPDDLRVIDINAVWILADAGSPNPATLIPFADLSQRNDIPDLTSGYKVSENRAIVSGTDAHIVDISSPTIVGSAEFLHAGTAHAWDPIFSPDGTRVSFATTGFSPHIWVRDVTLHPPGQPVDAYQGTAGSLAWRSDSDVLAILTGGGPRLIRVTANSASAPQPIAGLAAGTTGITWQPPRP